jgi:hypothetical protein
MVTRIEVSTVASAGDDGQMGWLKSDGVSAEQIREFAAGSRRTPTRSS